MRYFSLEGIVVPTPQETARSEILKVEQARQQTEQEHQRAEEAITQVQELQARGRSLGISLEEII